MKTQLERFQNKTLVLPNGCLEWTGNCYPTGYGRFYESGAHGVRAHRWAYETFIGPIPSGMQIDHLCHDPHTCRGGVTDPHRRCVNTEHMALVSVQQNLARRSSVIVTACPKGHDYDEANTYLVRGTSRQCRECSRVRSRNYQRRLRAELIGA